MRKGIHTDNLCVKCKQPLGFNFAGFDITNLTTFCINKECDRYGLVTVVYTTKEIEKKKECTPQSS